MLQHNLRLFYKTPNLSYDHNILKISTYLNNKRFFYQNYLVQITSVNL